LRRGPVAYGVSIERSGSAAGRTRLSHLAAGRSPPGRGPRRRRVARIHREAIVGAVPSWPCRPRRAARRPAHRGRRSSSTSGHWRATTAVTSLGGHPGRRAGMRVPPPGGGQVTPRRRGGPLG